MPKKFVRESKFRHVFGDCHKKERCFENIKVASTSWDGGSYCAVNSKFLAVVTESCSGGGSFIVLPLTKTGRLDASAPKVTGHKGRIFDIQWNPFNENLIASGSEDCTIKVWNIPDVGITSDLTDSVVDLVGHQKRVVIIRWHPLVNNIIASAAMDMKIILWNVQEGIPAKVLDLHNAAIFSMQWSLNGQFLATTSQDKKLRIINVRNEEIEKEYDGHEGAKTSHVCFLSDDKILTTGFSKMSERQVMIRNIENGEVLAQHKLNSAPGSVLPFYDVDTKILFLAGKGDSTIRYFEIDDTSPYLHALNEFRSSLSQRALGVLPKRALNVNSCEIFRFYKLHSTGLCEPISMIVPRKSDRFQSDIYPLTQGDISSLEANDWLKGKNAEPKLISLKDGFVPTKKEFNAPEKTIDLIINSQRIEPPRNDRELRKVFYEQQDEISRLQQRLQSKDLQIRQLEYRLAQVTTMEISEETSTE